jgi:hypothetical protein
LLFSQWLPLCLQRLLQETFSPLPELGASLGHLIESHHYGDYAIQVLALQECLMSHDDEALDALHEFALVLGIIEVMQIHQSEADVH